MKTKTTKKLHVIFMSFSILLISFYVAANYDPALFNDADQDGLSDAEELTYKTDPTNNDTDGDGYSDGVEVKSGYDPLKPAPGDRIVKKKRDGEVAAPQGNLTNKLIQEFDILVEEKDGTPITSEEVDLFIKEKFKQEIENETANKPLPVIDVDKITVIPTELEGLSETEQLEKRQNQFAEYLSNTMYLLENTDPLKTKDNRKLEDFFSEFTSKSLALLSDPSAKEFIINSSEKAENFVNSSYNEIKVPEEMLDTHVKFMTIMMGFADLREYSSLKNPGQDKVADIILLSRIRYLMEILNDLLVHDLKKEFAS